MCRLLLLALAVLSSGCAIGAIGVLSGAVPYRGPYEADELARQLGPRAVRKLGCLEIGFVLLADQKSELIDMHVGNGCGHLQALDLEKLRITGRDAAGNEVGVSLRDPRDEIGPVHVGGYERGTERLRLERERALAQVCLEVGGIAPDAPGARPAPICLGGDAASW